MVKADDLHTNVDGIWAYVGVDGTSLLIEQDDGGGPRNDSDMLVLNVSSVYELRAWLDKILPPQRSVETIELQRLRTEMLEVNKALGLDRDNQDSALRVKTALRLRLPVEPKEQS